ncbi:hypothetical protein GCM10009796_23200 [Microbacterium koreense]
MSRWASQLNQEPSEACAALRAAVEVESVETLQGVVARHLWTLRDQCFEELTDAIQRVPGRELDDAPLLKLLHPMTPVIAASSAPFDTNTLASVDAPSAVARDTLVALQTIAAQWSGDMRASATHAEELRRRIYEESVPERAQRGSNLWFLHYCLASTLVLTGDTAAGARELATSRVVARKSGSTQGERSSLARLALVDVLRGSVREAGAALRAARELAPYEGAYTLEGAGTEAVAEVLIALERGEAVDLRQLDAVEPTAFTWPFFTLARARCALLGGQPAQAVEAVRATVAAHRVQDGTLAADILAAIYIDAFLGLGNERAAARAGLVVREPGPTAKTAHARLALARGDVDAAARLIEELSGEAWACPAREHEITCLLAWESAARGAVGAGVARRFAALADTPTARRILASTPAWVVQAVAQALPALARDDFEARITGLVFAEIGRSTVHLTASEQRVFDALSQHERVADLASALFLSPNTIKTHLSSLYRKLGVSSRREAIAARRTLVREEIGADLAEPRRAG